MCFLTYDLCVCVNMGLGFLTMLCVCKHFCCFVCFLAMVCVYVYVCVNMFLFLAMSVMCLCEDVCF